MSHVIVVGSANIDITASVRALPQPGQTLLSADARLRPGGKGANQAVAARQFGARTTLYAAVGDDPFGRQLRDALADRGVGRQHVVEVTDRTTGFAMITVADDGENTIVVAPGANFALHPGVLVGLQDELVPGDVVLLQLEVPVETGLAAATVAGRIGARVVLNAAPMVAPMSPGLDELLRAVDVLVVNESEAAALIDVPAPGAPPAWTSVAGALRRFGPDAVVITLGGDGAVAHDRDGAWVQGAFPATVVDTTGAGDAFCGVLAAALADGLSLRRAVRRGCAAGAAATEAYGAQAALPNRTELDRVVGADA
jgi:ribokinase